MTYDKDELQLKDDSPEEQKRTRDIFEELKKDLEWMLRAFEMDILTYEDINPKPKGD